MRGERDTAAVDRMAARVAALSNRDARILVAHGASDLVTPYFDQLPVYGSPDRAALSRRPHVLRQDESRRTFRRDAEAFYRAVLQGGAKE